MFCAAKAGSAGTAEAARQLRRPTQPQPQRKSEHERRHRRIGRQGQDHQQVPGLRLQGAWPPSAMCATCRPRTARSSPTTTSRCTGTSTAASAEGHEGDRRGRQGRRQADPRHRPRSRGRGHLLAHPANPRAEEGAEEGHAGRARRLQRHHQAGRAGRARSTRARSTSRWSRPISPAARSTISSASRCRRCCGASCRAPARPAACSRWRCASSATARPRSRPSRPTNTGPSRRCSRRAKGEEFAARLTAIAGTQAEEARHQGRGLAPTPSRPPSRSGDFRVASVEKKAVQAQPVRRRSPPRRCRWSLAQARLLGQADHAGRPAPLRRRRHRRRDGRPHHLHANRRRPRSCRRRSPPSATLIERELRQALPAAVRPRVQDQGQERPGSARGDPPDRCRAASPSDVAQASRARPGAPLRADLEARGGEPDGLGRARADHRRDRGQGPRRQGLRRCAPPARSCSSTASSRSTRKAATTGMRRARKTADEDEDSRRLPPLAAGRPRSRTSAIEAEQHFTAAAAALHRGDPGQAHGGARHRPALDLCLDARRAAGSRLRRASTRSG